MDFAGTVNFATHVCLSYLPKSLSGTAITQSSQISQRKQLVVNHSLPEFGNRIQSRKGCELNVKEIVSGFALSSYMADNTRVTYPTLLALVASFDLLPHQKLHIEL